MARDVFVMPELNMECWTVARTPTRILTCKIREEAFRPLCYSRADTLFRFIRVCILVIYLGLECIKRLRPFVLRVLDFFLELTLDIPMDFDLDLDLDLDFFLELGVDIPMDFGLGVDIPIDFGLGVDILVDFGLGVDIPIDFGLGVDIPMDFGLGVDILVDFFIECDALFAAFAYSIGDTLSRIFKRVRDISASYNT